MNKNLPYLVLISLLVGFFSIAVEARTLEYNFSIKSDHLSVKLCTIGNDSGSTKFLCPLIIGMDNDQDTNIETEIAGISKNITLEGDYLTLTHQPRDKICLTSKLHNFQTEPNLYFYLLKDNFVMFGSYVLFLLQDAEEQLHKVIFTWDNYQQNIISNFWQSTLKSSFTVQASNTTLSHSFFIGGSFNTCNIAANNCAVSQLIFFADFPLAQQPIISDLQKIQNSHNNFFQDTGYTKSRDYYIFLSDHKHPAVSTGFRQNGGNFSYQAMSLGANLTPLQVQSIIAHEHLHKWLGGIIRQDLSMQEYNAWFIEGITDYYTGYFNYQSGLWSLEDYLTIYNNCLYRYFSSPNHIVSSEDISRNWQSFQYISYLRGNIIGHELDYQLRQATNNKYNFDIYVQYLNKIAKNNSAFKFSTDSFNSTIKELTGYNANDFIQHNIIGSKLSVKASKILDGKAVLIFKKMPVADYGFDQFHSFLNWQLTGVDENSKGYKEGLRNGWRILSIWEPQHDNKFITLRIKNNNAIKTIKFIPEYKEMLIPQYISMRQ